MPQYQVPFGTGAGLQISAAEKGQAGLLEAENVDVERADVLRKRPGERELGLQRSVDPLDLIPASTVRAVWNRQNEGVIEADNGTTGRRLYSWQRCAAGASGAVVTGTATPLEISNGLAVLTTRADRTPDIDVTLPGDPNAAAARTRAGRPANDPPILANIGPRTVTLSLSVTTSNPAKLAWTALEGTTFNGPNTLPGPGLQRLGRMQDVQSFPGVGTEDFLITYISGGTLFAVQLTLQAGQAAMTLVVNVLDVLRGPPDSSAYDARLNLIAAFVVNGTLRTYISKTLGVANYAVANFPPSDGLYTVDLGKASTSPFDRTGVSWLGTDNVMHVAQLDPNAIAVEAQASAPNLAVSASRQVGIEGAIGDWAVAVVSSGVTTKPAFRFDVAGADLALRVVDLDGPDLRLAVTSTDADLSYRLKNAATDESISTNISLGYVAADIQLVNRADEVFGASFDPVAATVLEHRWRRQFELTATPVASGAAVQFAVAQSAGRFVLGFWTAPTDLAILAITDVDDTGTTTVAYLTTEAVDITLPVAIGILTELGLDGYSARVSQFLADEQYYSFTGTSTALSPSARVTAEVVELWGELPEFTSSLSQGAPPRVMFGAQFASGSHELWEDDQPAPLFVKVAPPTVVPAGGTWVDRGPWTRTRVRSDVVRRFAAGSVISADAAGVLNDDGEFCAFVATENPTGVSPFVGALADVVSTHTESEITLDATGLRPRVATYDSQRAAVTYFDAGGQLQTAIWSPGSVLAFGPVAGATPTDVNSWDITAGVATGTSLSVVAWDKLGGGGVLEIYISPEGGTPFSYTRAHALVPTDVAVFLEERDGIIYIAWAVSGAGLGVAGFVTGLDTVTIAGADAAVFQRTVNIAGLPTTFAVAVGRSSATETAVWLETDESSVGSPPTATRRIREYTVRAASETLERTVLRTAIATQLALIGDDLVGVESMIAVPQVQPALPAQQFQSVKTTRNGLVLRSHRSGEIVGRISITLVEDAPERDERYPHTGLNVDPSGRLVMGWQETTFDTADNDAPSSAIYIWDPNTGAHNPAELDGVAIAAHGGYPRMYDGLNVHEHDWAHLPTFDQPPSTVAVASPVLAGLYTIAITWEDEDAQGLLYRSRPVIYQVTTAAGDAINVNYRGLTHTERVATKAVFWRSIVNGEELYREAENLAVGFDVQLQQLTAADETLLASERLDQGDAVAGAGDEIARERIIPSDPIEITDFTAGVNGRVISRHPRRRRSLYFSTTSRALFESASTHWSGRFVLEHTGVGPVTAAAEMDSRIVILSTLDASVVFGDGPSNTGVGSYSIPSAVPVDIGTNDHATLTLIPEGLVYGADPTGDSPKEVQLVTRGMSSAPLANPVADAFHGRGQRVVAGAYIKATDTLLLLDSADTRTDSTRTLRYNTNTARWAHDTLRQGRDLTQFDNGELLILTTNGRVLLERLDMYSSGGVGYVTRVRTAWLKAQGGNFLTNTGDFQVVHIVGRWEGPHALTIRIRHSYDETIVEEVTIPEATITAHASAGEPYVYQYNLGAALWAVSVEVADGGEPNPTFALERIAVWVDTSNHSGKMGDAPAGHVFQAGV